MHEWQVIAMELRDRALEARKRHNEIYMLEQESKALADAEYSESCDELATSIDELAGAASEDELANADEETEEVNEDKE